MNAGYVYVIEFDNGTVKVGQSKAISSRLRMHKQNARGFGLKMTRHWVSPRHCGWLENEEVLKRIARELGGEATTPEFFTGVSFDALTERSRALSFKSPEGAQAIRKTDEAQRSQSTGVILREEIARMARDVKDGYTTEASAAGWLEIMILGDLDFARRLAGRYVRGQLRDALRCESDTSAPQTSKPTPPAEESASASVRLRAEQFTRYLEAQGIKGHAEIADRAGLDKTTVFRLLKGQSDPGGRFIAAILATFPDRCFEDFFEVTAPEPATRKRAA